MEASGLALWFWVHTHDYPVVVSAACIRGALMATVSSWVTFVTIWKDSCLHWIHAIVSEHLVINQKNTNKVNKQT